MILSEGSRNGWITYVWKACWYSLKFTDVSHDSPTNPLEPQARNLDLVGGLWVVWRVPTRRKHKVL